MAHRGERTAVFIFGVVFVLLLVSIAVFIPEPTQFQYTTFRIVLALAAAGIAAFIPGFLEVELNSWLRAGGAIAVFVIVYFFSPASLITTPQTKNTPSELKTSSEPYPGSELSFVTEAYKPDENGDNAQLLFTVWNRSRTSRIRISEFKISTLKQAETVQYCCPEYRSALSLDLQMHDPAKSSKESSLDTYEIPPLSSNAFAATIKIKHGMADGDPIVLFGVTAKYSTPSGGMYEGRSDRLYLANYRGDRNGPATANFDFDRSGYIKLIKSNEFFERWLGVYDLGWFPCPWTGTILPPETRLDIPDSEKEATTQNSVNLPRSPIFQADLRDKFYNSTIHVSVWNRSLVTWEDFKKTYPTAILGCDGKRVLEKYKGALIKIIVSYVNEGPAELPFQPLWSLTSSETSTFVSENELIPKEISEQPLSSDYYFFGVSEMRSNQDIQMLKPKQSIIRELYFKPAVPSKKPIYMVEMIDKDSKFRMQIQ